MRTRVAVVGARRADDFVRMHAVSRLASIVRAGFAVIRAGASIGLIRMCADASRAYIRCAGVTVIVTGGGIVGVLAFPINAHVIGTGVQVIAGCHDAVPAVTAFPGIARAVRADIRFGAPAGVALGEAGVGLTGVFPAAGNSLAPGRSRTSTAPRKYGFRVKYSILPGGQLVVERAISVREGTTRSAGRVGRERHRP